jgi:signal transduction histidine kinase
MADIQDRFDRRIAGRMRAASQVLAKRWLERLDDILTVDRDRIFPTKDLLDHVPQLIEEIAAYIDAPEVEELAANSAVVAKARELGLLRYAQQASVHQLLREYSVLGGILETFVSEEAIPVGSDTSPREVLAVASRISHGLRVLQQTTIDTFIAQYTDRIAAQHARLESFNRLVSHELRQPLGTLQFSIRTLGTPIAAEAVKRERLVEVAAANVQRLIDLTRRLEQIARLQHREEDDPDRQEVDLSALAREVARQLREMAEKRDVEIRIAEDLPVIVTDVARVELVLMNLISNAIKYSDASKAERHVDIFLSGGTDDGHTICVRDNGVGVPAGDVPRIFESFFRASPEKDAQLGIRGSGLGLAIVAECVEAIGGRISVASVEGEGTAFDVWLPTTDRPRETNETTASLNEGR